MVSGSRVKALVVRSIRDRSAVGVLHTTLMGVTCPLLIRSHKSGLSRSSWRKFLSWRAMWFKYAAVPCSNASPFLPSGRMLRARPIFGCRPPLASTKSMLSIFSSTASRSKLSFPPPTPPMPGITVRGGSPVFSLNSAPNCSPVRLRDHSGTRVVVFALRASRRGRRRSTCPCAIR